MTFPLSGGRTEFLKRAENELEWYCGEVERAFEHLGYTKVPIEYQPEHFTWLVRYQVKGWTVEADLRHLSAVLRWATLWQDREGRYLLRENPVRGYSIPREKNPRRPIQTQDRYEALLRVADQVTFEVIRERKRVRLRSYLPELLTLANDTGRRLSAILGLTYADLHTERTSTAPHGAVTWPADTV